MSRVPYYRNPLPYHLKKNAKCIHCISEFLQDKNDSITCAEILDSVLNMKNLSLLSYIMQTNKEKNTKYIYCVKNIYHNNVMVQNYILTKFESCCPHFRNIPSKCDLKNEDSHAPVFSTLRHSQVHTHSKSHIQKWHLLSNYN